ncbi:hypothetical protein GGX14DRAFT_559430 [Mycena pura]|uniref:Uncharacterized protein n=1 Tax=Mycena pura TaxID=153505 RepID=A0AAD6VUD8_9AGAR|nr:hypothetical protein GGX14DRAFT_559430 [Mycena pura]
MGQLTSMQWKRGLKTGMYYLRTQPVPQATEIESEVERGELCMHTTLSISNTLLGTEPIARPTIETRLSKLESEIAEIKYDLHVLRRGKRKRMPQFPPSTPLLKRTTHDNEATAETPIVRSSVMASTLARDEMMRDVSEGIQQSLRELHRQSRA